MADNRNILVSLFTPTHNPQERWLAAIYEQIKQTQHQNWEWIIYVNGDGYTKRQVVQKLDDIWKDERVKIYITPNKPKGVGEAKKQAVSYCRGELLVELDHDDRPYPNMIDELLDAYVESNGQHSFFYSDDTHIDDSGKWEHSKFDERHGWRYYQGQMGETVCAKFPPHPHNIAYIWYAPNHVRAFTREAYQKTRGYNENLEILDDQELMYQLYMQGDFYHIQKPLYAQRKHEKQTQVIPRINKEIQQKTREMYINTIQPMMLKWAERKGLRAIDLGSAHRKPEGYEGLDIRSGDGVDIVHDANQRLPFPDNSIGVIRAVDFLEHIENPVHIMNEIHRVLADGGMLLSLTPSTDGRGAFQDPTHVSFYNENSFWYYTKENIKAFVPEIQAKFQASYISTTYLTGWHKEHNIPYVCANLIKTTKGERKYGGIVE